MEKEVKYEIYVDGSALNKRSGTTFGGYGAVLVVEGKKVAEYKGKDQGINSMQAELHAVILGLFSFIEEIDPEEGTAVILHTDSKIISDCFKYKWYEEWMRQNWILRKNSMLWKLILSLINQFQLKVEFRWVRGHSGVEFNEIAHNLANEARLGRKPKLKPIWND